MHGILNINTKYKRRNMVCPFGKHVVYNDKVLDASAFVPNHPGGPSTLANFLGCDITDAFLAMHGPKSRAHRLVNELNHVGTIDKGMMPLSPVQTDFRKMTLQLHERYKEREIHVRLAWFFDLSICIALFIGAYYVSFKVARRGAFAIGAILLGLAFFQLGWISHDIAHKQVIHDHKLLQPIIAFYGNILGGYSYDWWRTKHNRMHHPNTNIIGKDEDIDTMPLIAWDQAMLKERGGPNWFVRHQSVLLWPVLCMARLWWRVYSIIHVVRKHKYTEMVFLIVHYVLYFGFVYALGLGIVYSILFVLAAEMLAGFLTAFVFIQSHNAKKVSHSMDTDFWTHQIESTSNIRPSFLTNLFSGYLNFQIEHHLWPWLPRHMLPSVQGPLKDLCMRHGLVYREYTWVESTLLVLRHLRNIAVNSEK